MKTIILVITSLFLLISCSKKDDNQTTSSNEIKNQNLSVLESLPKEQREFQTLLSNSPVVPKKMRGTREGADLESKEKEFQDQWEISSVGTQGGVNKVGMSEVKDWKCVISAPNEIPSQTNGNLLTCHPLGLEGSKWSLIDTDNFSSNTDKFYVGDMLTISGKIKNWRINPLSLLGDLPNNYHLSLVNSQVVVEKK